MPEAHDRAVIRADRRQKRVRTDLDLLLSRAEHLPEGDALLLRALFETGLSAVALATIQNSDPRAVRRQARRLLRRLNDPLFLFVVREGSGWSAQRRQVAQTCIVEGRSLRSASAHLGLSMYCVRRHIEAVRALFDSASKPARSASTPAWRETPAEASA